MQLKMDVYYIRWIEAEIEPTKTKKIKGIGKKGMHIGLMNWKKL